MMTKEERQNAILELIADSVISTQDELIGGLHSRGIEVTQATVSRDIRELNIIKRPYGNDYRYARAGSSEPDLAGRYMNIFSQAVISAENAGNICCIKCHSGAAQAAGAALDSMSCPEVLGTIAGDDTIFVLCKDEKCTASFLRRISDYIGK